jgi:hypothetical protein
MKETAYTLLRLEPRHLCDNLYPLQEHRGRHLHKKLQVSSQCLSLGNRRPRACQGCVGPQLQSKSCTVAACGCGGACGLHMCGLQMCGLHMYGLHLLERMTMLQSSSSMTALHMRLHSDIIVHVHYWRSSCSC